MTAFNVMAYSTEELDKKTADPDYQPVAHVHCTIEACNESVAQANLRRSIIDGTMPKGTWVE